MRLAITFILLNAYLLSQHGFADAFQSLGTSSRMAGLAQAVVADPGYDASYLVNPSSTSLGSGLSGYAQYINQFGMAEYGSFGIQKSMENSWRIGLHGLGIYIDNLLERPDLRPITDLETRRDSIRTLLNQGFKSFSDLESSVTVNASKTIPYDLDLGWQIDVIPLRIPVGVNIHLMHKNLHDIQGSGIGMDIGTMVSTDLNKIFFFDWMGELAFGLTVKHLFGTRIFWNTKRQDLIPMHFVYGCRYEQSIKKIDTKIRFFNQTNSLYKNDMNMAMEVMVRSRLSIQAGYRAETIHGNINIHLNGILFPGTIGYGMAEHPLGMVHRLGCDFEL